MRKARIEDGVVREVLELEPFPPFSPELVWVECGPEVGEGWGYDGTSFAQPPAEDEGVLAVSPAKFREALLNANLLDTVETAVAASDRKTKIWWEFATEFRSDNPKVLTMAAQLSVNPSQLIALFKAASAL